MGSQLSEQPATDPGDPGTDAPPQPWSTVTKIAFRFCFLYFGLFCLLFAQITFAFFGIVGEWLPKLAVMWQMTLLGLPLQWVGREVFGVDAVLHPDSGSGDQTVVWVMVFTLAVVAAVGTAVWTLMDRRRPDYARLSAWFLTFLRLCVAGQMLFYGFAKLVPTQMPSPPPSALLRSFGDLSPASVLWLQVGSSHPYEMTLGAVEVLAGLLMFLPRTATLGTLLGLASMAQVFLLNMTFDVPVKILSGHLLLMSLVLLAPQLRRLTDLFVLQRPAEPVSQPPLFSSERANRRAATAQAVLGLWVLAGCILASWQAWHAYGGGKAKPELYGIWSVREFSVDGKPLPPLTTDQTRWQRLVFETDGALTYQRMNGELVDAPATIKSDTITATGPGGAALAELKVSRPAARQLQLTGTLQGRPVQITLDQVDLDQFTLRNRGFHWVQEYPFFK
ncbi:DoxX family protein [Mycolicibacterium mucogenicum]|uniref:DoxX family protein n=1 Tax=Mycolicibacterium mucogenicum TaxID=56689 RepID=UPI000AFCC003|nr:DoxX family protein [Mycolicibacterium mucogenicum]